MKGLYTAIITPFNDDFSLNEDALRQQIQFQVQNNVDGIVVLGTTGEAPTLKKEEKERILKIAKSETNGKILLGVGTGSYSTDETIYASKQARDFGADFLLVVTPYYNKPMPEGYYQHYKALHEEVLLPIVVYNIAGRTAKNMPTDILYRLSDLENIVGVKEASGDLSQMMDVIYKIKNKRPDFAVLSGDDALTLPLFSLGGDGIISVLSNVLPSEMKVLCKACLNKDYELAKEVHYQLYPLMKSLFNETNPIPVKGLMNYLQRMAGSCRLPLTNINEDNLQKIIADYNTACLVSTS